MADSQAAQVLVAWHDAVNSGDVERAVSLCSDDVAVTGPRGVGHGRELVRSWLNRSGIRLAPQGELVEARGRFVVTEMATWTAAGPPVGAPAVPTPTWCVFTVSDALVTSIARYESEADVPLAG